ncbi:MAG: PEGA domain-containing protein [Myxococcaceae bacterium]
MLTIFTLTAILATSPATATEKSLWLLQPLYPGQEALLPRAEEAVRGLIAPEDRATHVVGAQDFLSFLKTSLGADKPPATSCLAEAQCGNALGSLMTRLGIERVQLIRAGQDETGYRVRLVTYRPKDNQRAATEGTSPTLDKALLGAIVKADQLVSTLEVKSTPAGAVVWVDGEKMGTTPMLTQVLPGERTLRLHLPNYLPLEIKQNVPVRQKLLVDRTLEKVPARLVADVKPESADVLMDGSTLGQGKLDVGILPGTHVFEAKFNDHEPLRIEADVKPGETYTFTGTLQPTGWGRFKKALGDAQAEIYARDTYLDVAFEWFTLNGDRVAGRRFGDGVDANSRTARLLSPGAGANLYGVGVEYGRFWRYFGMVWFGLAYGTSSDPWTLEVQNPTPGAETVVTRGDFLHLRALQPQVRIALWRFVFALQVGLELRGGRIAELVDSGNYLEGFAVFDLHGTARLSVRAFIVSGFYVQAAFRYSIPLVGSQTAGNQLSSGFRAFSFGAGYAF